MINYNIKPEDHPLFGLVEDSKLNTVIINSNQSLNEAYDSNQIQVNYEPSGYYHPREIVGIVEERKSRKLSPMFTLNEWFEYYTDLCSGNILPINSIEKERERLIKESNNKEITMLLGYNPELPFTIESKLSQSRRLNSLLGTNYKLLSEDEILSENVVGKTPIYVILTRTFSNISNAINKVTGDEYTHSSISFDLKLDKMYSFNRQGFYIDTLDEFKTFGNIPFAVYGVYVNDNMIPILKKRLDEFIAMKDKFKYSQIGLLGVLINKPIVFNDRRFCSEFVDELLKVANIDITGKASALVRPQEFKNENIMFKVFEGRVNDYKQSVAQKISNAFTENGNLTKSSDANRYYLESLDSRINESTIVSKEDSYINFDKWSKGKGTNVLFITGLSGSGKSTLAEELSYKHNAQWIELDLIEYNTALESEVKHNRSCSILLDYFRKRGFINSHDMNNHQVEELFMETYNYLIDYANKHPNELFIFEGIQIFVYLNARYDIKDKPIIIKGTSTVKSTVRRIKRYYRNDLTAFIKDLSINTVNRHMYDYKLAMQDDRNLSKLKKLVTNEATLPVEFDKEGNMIVKSIAKLDYQKEWDKSHKLLLTYEKTQNIEGMKYELAKLWYLNTKIERILHDSRTSDTDKKKYTDIRARILNDFNKYFAILSKDKTFNFTEYYEGTPFSLDSVKISKHTIFHTINIAKQITRL